MFKIIRKADRDQLSEVSCHTSIEVPEKPLSYKFTGARNIVTPTELIIPAKNNMTKLKGS